MSDGAKGLLLIVWFFLTIALISEHFDLPVCRPW